MYSYDRRATAPRSFYEAVDRAVKGYGVKPGLERQVQLAKLTAHQLDQSIRAHNGLNPDDAWASDTSKLQRLWRELQGYFQQCFGYDPPALDGWL